jgi:myosin heavy subunit
MELKSEKSIKEYLKTLPDDTIIKYYLDVEYSPFPILLIEEYTRRFKRKTKDEIIKDLKLQTRLAHKKTRELGEMAKKHKLVDDVTRQKSDEIIKHAKKKGYTISEKIALKGSVLGSRLKKKTKSSIKSGLDAGKKLKTSSHKDLDLLKKLNDLQKAGIITNKEFQEKKKKILSKI